MIHAKVLPANWKQYLKPLSGPPLIVANRDPLNAIGEIPQYLPLGEFRPKVRFAVVTNMAVTCILGTIFIGRFVKAINSGPKLIHLNVAPPVVILGSKFSLPKTCAVHKRNAISPPTATTSDKIQLAKLVRIPAMFETQVLVRSDHSGFVSSKIIRS